MKDLSREEWLEQDISILEQNIEILEQEVREAREEKIKQKISRLEREEKIKQEISRLEKLISEKDNAFDEEQWKRCKRTFWGLSGVIYLVAFMCGEISGIWHLMWLIAAPIMSGFIMFISLGVCYYIMSGAIKRAETLARLKAELYTIKYFDKIYK